MFYTKCIKSNTLKNSNFARQWFHLIMFKSNIMLGNGLSLKIGISLMKSDVKLDTFMKTEIHYM